MWANLQRREWGLNWSARAAGLKTSWMAMGEAHFFRSCGSALVTSWRVGSSFCWFFTKSPDSRSWFFLGEGNVYMGGAVCKVMAQVGLVVGLEWEEQPLGEDEAGQVGGGLRCSEGQQGLGVGGADTIRVVMAAP